MKKVLLLVFFICLGQHLIAQQMQQIKITTLQVKNNLPANIDEWQKTPAALLMVAQKQRNAALKEIKIVVQIKNGGNIVCGNTFTTAQPIAPFEVRTFTSNELIGYLNNCKTLKDGSYQLCVQFFNLDKLPISDEVCREFIVETQNANDFEPPTLISPDNGTIFSEQDLKKPLQFRWTPLVPKPREQVTYRLRVWQLMQGQKAATARAANTPIVDKEVKDITQTIVPNLNASACTTPYTCTFVWQIQATNKDGKPIGKNNGSSGLYTFSSSNCDANLQIKVDSVRCLGVDGTNSIYKICIRSIYQSITGNLSYTTPGAGLFALHPSSTPTYPISGMVPAALVTQNSGVSVTTQTYCFTVAVPTSQTSIYIMLQGDDINPGPAVCKPGADTLINLPPCICNFCNTPSFVLNAPVPTTINYNGGQLNLSQPLTITTTPIKTIKNITADLVYFEMQPENDACISCNKDAQLYGIFANGTNTEVFTNTNNNQVIPIKINTPNLIACCKASFKWCIRYKVEFTDCSSCSKIICYQKTKEGCASTAAIESNPAESQTTPNKQ
jgi:hypothetical protein